MKNRNEINAYLKKLRAATVEDKGLIEAFLSEKGLKVKVKVRNLTIPEISFKQFREWYDKILPHTNEIIYSEGCKTLGIVKEIGVNHITLGVAFRDNQLITEPVDIPMDDFREASEGEILKLQHILSERNLRWTRFYVGLVSSYKLGTNDQIRITRLGIILGYGVFKEINDKGELVTFCVKMKDEPVRYNLHEIVGPVKDYQLEPVTSNERKYMANALSEAKKQWNGYQSRIEPLNSRGKIGETYYYINDYMEIIATKESGKPKDLKRYRKLNYYIIRGDAEEILTLIEEKRKRQLINNEEIDMVKMAKKR
ncbi:MAG TPA: hypothetical protein DCZ19_01055 [Porphyromonadaceae bacterium]|jgi:hypothetical protein|nr:hypothetical protein [Porphyromonadaceae bacterium]